PVKKAIVHRPRGEWPNERAIGCLTLDFDHRHRRRIRLVTDQGDEVLLDFSNAIPVADRDGLQLDDGTWLLVRAAAEPVVDISHPEPRQLARLAWPLGNRHLPTEIRGETLRIRPDHVVEDMLRGFGANVARLEAAFQPEGGAYGDRRAAPHGASDHHGHP